MKQSLLLTALILAGCVDTRGMPNFERMSEAELAEYNRERPLAQMIVCSDEERSFSRVRRRHCMTVEQMYGSADQASQLDVLHTVPGFDSSNAF
jgi:DNA mismatch repair ATPase MutS